MARIGGAFPLPLAQVVEGGSRIQLASGGMFYPPPGEYTYLNDANTVLQFFDGQSQSWQGFDVPSAGGYISVDGYNYRYLNNSGIVNSVTISTPGTGATNGIGFAATGVAAAIAVSNTTGGIRATCYVIVGGSVAAPTITQIGSGFLEPPYVVIDPPPQGGIQATAIAVLTAGGALSAITMVNVGAGYTASPNFWLIPQSPYYQGGPQGGNAAGSIIPPGLVFPANAVPGNQNTSPVGAQLTSVALTGSGTITGIVMTNNGGGYTSAAPAVTITGSNGTAVGVVSNTTPVNSLVISQPRVQ